MTNHPITPPPELVEQLRSCPGTWLDQITAAYQAGADMELEACHEWLVDNSIIGGFPHLRTSRRPKPPSLKEQALAVINSTSPYLDETAINTIRKALEEL